MSQTQTVTVALPGQSRSLPVQSRPLVFAAAEAISVPWTIRFAMTGITFGMLGAISDFAWHMSIGRETFLTPPHIMIGIGGVLVGLACAYVILTTTFRTDSPARDASVQVLGLRAPVGAFIGFWGSFAMVASAPFDNWWHNAYGLDLQFITPPHALLSLGYFATKIGAMAWLASMINRSERVLQERLSWLLLMVGSFCVMLLSVSTMPSTLRVNMHTAACYLAVALLVPCMMIATGWGSARKWGCTIVAAVYMSIGMGLEWVLPLFSAEPKVGPVYHNVNHMIPLPFPLLLIVPAFVADLLLQKLKQRSSWIKAICIGPAFVLSFFAVQWPFANFLMSPASRNWFFGTAYFAYADPAGILYDPYKFKIAEKSLGAFMLTMLVALVVSIVTTRLGLGWGNWMRRVRR